MDGTLFVARAQDQFSGGHALYFWAHLPSTRLALLHQRYSISAAHVRYGKNKGFMSGTLFALVPCFNRCPGGGVDFIHERRGTIFSANFVMCGVLGSTRRLGPTDQETRKTSLGGSPLGCRRVVPSGSHFRPRPASYMGRTDRPDMPPAIPAE
jgi:hypothetical protein